MNNPVIPQPPFRGFSDALEKNKRRFKHDGTASLLSLAIAFGNTLQSGLGKFKEMGYFLEA